MSDSPLKAKILIVEDDQMLNEQVSKLLIEKGYDTHQCYDGQEALVTAISQKFDLILLDVLLPSLDGFEILKRLRTERRTPVIMLTACGAEQERITGLSYGADDYVSKPFNFTELQLRIDALLRRTMGRSDQLSNPAELSVDALTLNRHELSVHVGANPVTLTPIQFKLLWTLVKNQSETLSKPYLYQLVLEREYSRYDRSLDMHLSRVRKKLVSNGLAVDQLKTVHGAGYCFA